MQPGKEMLHVEAVTDGIAVHTSDARMRKQLLQTLFALLRTSAQIKQMLALALRAPFGHGLHVSAIVTFEPLPGWIRDGLSRDNGFVMGKSNGAVFALQLFAAGPA